MWSDKETNEDCLGFSAYTETLGKLALEPDIAPLTIGIFGNWGSGKTSLMRMIKSYLDEKHRENAQTIWFNAWQYEGKDEIQSALIHAILIKLERAQTLTDEIRGLFTKLKENANVIKLSKFIAKSAITLTPDFSGLLDCFSDESNKLADSMEGFHKTFQELLTKLKINRIVVFVDDLDRCISSRVIEIF